MGGKIAGRTYASNITKTFDSMQQGEDKQCIATKHVPSPEDKDKRTELK